MSPKLTIYKEYTEYSRRLTLYFFISRRLIVCCHSKNKFSVPQKGELFKKIDLTLSGSPAGRTGSLVRVVCCGKDTGVSLRYNNESAVVFVWVELRKLQPVDWDRITSKYEQCAPKYATESALDSLGTYLSRSDEEQML